jgi:hypothetical protein
MTERQMYALADDESGQAPGDFVGLRPMSDYPRFEYSMKQGLEGR